MREALALTARCQGSDDVPVGALVVDEAGRVLGEGWNRREEWGDPIAHAECVALARAAQARGGWRLEGCTLVVTLEPCLMCAGALINARVPRLVFGAWDDKAGAAGSVLDVLRERRLPHRVEVVAGVLAGEAEAQLAAFFAGRR